MNHECGTIIKKINNIKSKGIQKDSQLIQIYQRYF